MKQEPKVMKMYAKHITNIFDMPRSTQKILGYVLDKMNDENEVTIASGSKTVMLEALIMKPQTLNNGLNNLVKNNVLANPAKGCYVASPLIFTYKKKWVDTMNQQRKFRATIDYVGERFSVGGDWV